MAWVPMDDLDRVLPTAMTGSLVRTEGLVAAVAGMPAPVGAVVEIDRLSGPPVEGTVVAFRERQTLVFPLGELTGVRPGAQVRLKQTQRLLRVGDELLGRVVDARGQVMDGRPRPVLPHRVPLTAFPPLATQRPRVCQPLGTGVRVIDSLLTCGQGQRLGIFAGSGVGKSVLLGMMARSTSADVTVIGLIGERGREVNDFLERDLQSSGLARSVVVVATSDQPAVLRVEAAMTATAIAEYFRDQGQNVLLIMDSLTRFAQAQREIGLAAGEPPTTRGYPPSVFALLPRLVERAGRAPRGSITAFYSVLVEGDDLEEPVSDTVRGLLDGHLVLSRRLASQAHWPAIDVLQSLSRLFPDITPPDQQEAAQTVRELLAAYREHEDLITIGAYRPGSNPTVDAALAMREAIQQFLRQGLAERCDLESARKGLIALATSCQAARKSPAASTSPPRTNVR